MLYNAYKDQECYHWLMPLWEEMPMSPITAYHPFDAAVKALPYPFYAWLRQHQPVYYNAEYDFWALSRYEDIVWAARTPEIFSSAQGVGPDKRYGLSMISNDPPVHTRLRKLVVRAFAPHRIETYAPRIQAIIDDLLDAVLAKGSFELVADLAIPLPVTVISFILGVDPEYRHDFKRWSDDVVDFAASTAHGPAREKLRHSWEEFRDYFSRLLEARRHAPRDDVVTLLAQAESSGDVLTRMEFLNFCQLLLVAGNETTTNLISNGVLALAEFPEEEQTLRRQPALSASAVEEVLRYDTPVQLTYRTTVCDVAVRGVTIPAQSKVALLWGSANRDPSIFPEPERFDINRSPNHHVAFASGIHYCLGAPLARLEMRLTLETLLRRMRYLAIATDDAGKRVENPLLRGMQRLPLVFQSA
jgi:cytochrome P450